MHRLPNSGPLLCSPLELAKALLQTAYFSFFAGFYCKAVNPPHVWLRSHGPPANLRFIFLRDRRVD